MYTLAIGATYLWLTKKKKKNQQPLEITVGVCNSITDSNAEEEPLSFTLENEEIQKWYKEVGQPVSSSLCYG